MFFSLFNNSFDRSKLIYVVPSRMFVLFVLLIYVTFGILVLELFFIVIKSFSIGVFFYKYIIY